MGMTMNRYPVQFDIDIVKRPDLKKLGFRFEKPAGAALKELKITEISPDGLLHEVNEQNIAAGRWHMVVLTGMCVCQCNDVRDNDTLIAEELKNATGNLKLMIRRPEAAQNAMGKMKQKMNMLSAMMQSDQVSRASQSRASRSGASTPSRSGNFSRSRSPLSQEARAKAA